MKTNLYMIRHGEAVINVQPIVGGMKGDQGLTEHGVLQAQALRDRLRETGEIQAEVLIASDLPRARQTAEIIAPALGLPIVFDPEVQEFRVGEADGMPNSEAWAKYGPPEVEHNPFKRISPGGENWLEFVARVSIALHRITTTHAGKTIVVVCHGGVIDSSFIYFFGISTVAVPQAGLYTNNTSITHWQQYTDKYTHKTRWRLLGYNDTFHLREVGVRESLDWRDIAAKPDIGADRPATPLPTEERDEE
ncbi:MAG: histidine phosphatase family protein [Chloroflexaceae bacterium]|nr:histidine phosphatase family protein [Chloroflexaceae bacterium]